jgi:hypothetical protein
MSPSIRAHEGDRYVLTHVARVVETGEKTLGYLTEFYKTVLILNADHVGRAV